MNYQHLIGKRIRHRKSGNIFIPLIIKKDNDKIVVVDYEIVERNVYYDAIYYLMYQGKDIFAEYYELLNPIKITNWKKELENETKI